MISCVLYQISSFWILFRCLTISELFICSCYGGWFPRNSHFLSFFLRIQYFLVLVQGRRRNKGKNNSEENYRGNWREEARDKDIVEKTGGREILILFHLTWREVTFTWVPVGSLKCAWRQTSGEVTTGLNWPELQTSQILVVPRLPSRQPIFICYKARNFRDYQIKNFNFTNVFEDYKGLRNV